MNLFSGATRAILCCAMLCTTVAASTVVPPLAPVEVVNETEFGSVLTDPYRWMEANDSRFTAWLSAQANYTREALDALPERAAFLREIHSAAAQGSAPVNVRTAGDAIVYRRGASIYSRPLRGGPERTLVDALAHNFAAEHMRITTVVPSDDGRIVAYATIKAGSEAGTIRFVDTLSGRELPDVIEQADTLFTQSWWLDSKRFAYYRESVANTLTNTVPVIHRMADIAHVDAPVFTGTQPFKADDDTSLIVTPRYTIAIAATGYYITPTATLGEKSAIWQHVPGAFGHFANADQSNVYLLTAAPKFVVQTIDAEKPESPVRTVVESNDVLIASAFAADAVYFSFAHGATSRLGRLTYDGKFSFIDLPYDANILNIQANRATAGITLALSAWTRPTTWYRYAPQANFSDLGLGVPVAPAYADIVADEVSATSADGTAVPLSIIHARSMAYDGSHPTLLRVYGAFGISQTPAYDATILPWLARGGVIAVAHARGGGENGSGWAQAGKVLQKHHTVEDFLACAHYLIDRRITAARHLVGQGGSAAGIPIGVATVMHPELFTAMIDDVPVSDLLRSPLRESNISEFGSSNDSAQFAEMLAMSSYYHVQPGVRYPAMLLTSGANDPRVHVWEVAKMAARVQAATGSGKPVLLRVDFDSGHGASTGQALGELLADEYAFAFQQAGGAK